MFHAVTTHLGIDLQETGGGGGRLCRHTCLTIGFELHKVKNIRTHNNRLHTNDRATISFKGFRRVEALQRLNAYKDGILKGYMGDSKIPFEEL